MVELRPLNIETDLQRIVELTNMIDNEETSVELVREYETRVAEGQVRRRMIADDEGHIVGFSLVWGRESNPGQYFLSLVVDPERRGEGIGSTLLYDAIDWLRATDAHVVRSWVREDFPASLRFAQAHGFEIKQHYFESVIELDTFDETAFVDTLKRAEASGIRFFTMADVGNTDEAKRKLYELNKLAASASTSGDDDETFQTFEEFNRNVFEGSWYRADGQILAADGDDWVGLGAVWYSEPTGSMYNAFTGVDPSHRGRGIAQALKLLGIRTARRYGAAYIRTNNASTNAPMLAINRKLGYRPEPGTFGVERVLG